MNARRWTPMVFGMALVLFAVLGGSVSRSRAAVPAGFSEFYVPGGEEQLWDIMYDLDSYQLDESYGMHAVISVVAGADPTTIYYDHWEDGYDLDLADAENTYDEKVVLDPGRFKVFESSNIPINPRGTGLNVCGPSHNTVCYDGMDRFYTAGGAVTVSRASWTDSPTASTLHSLAWEVFPTKPWMTSYTIPIGQDLYGYPYNYAEFEKVYAIVQATTDNTSVTFHDPINGDSGPFALNQGEVADLYDLNTGTTVDASAPVQVHAIAGNDALHYQQRDYAIVPETLWDREYYVPVRSFAYRTGTGNQDTHNDTDVFIFNPSTVNLTVYWEDSSGQGTFSISPGKTLAYSDGTGHVLPQDSGAYLRGNVLFWGVSSVDVGSPDYDCGYSLIPVSGLVDDYVIGWAPSTLNLDAQGSPLFITPVADGTTIFVDYSPTDGVFDNQYTVDRLEILKIYDPDYDLTGSHVWATGLFAIAWGEDPDVASGGYDYLDMGYTSLPLLEDFLDLVLNLEKSVDPEVISPGAGQQVRFTLLVSSYDYSVDDVVVTDTLPANWSYVDDSTVITLPGGGTLSGNSADPDVAGQVLTWDQGGDMTPDQMLTISFEAVTTATPPDNRSRNPAEACGVRGPLSFCTEDDAFVYVSNLRMDKSSSAGGNVVYPGDTVTYTIVISNVGTAPATDVTVTDMVPAGATYVTDSTWVTAPGAGGGEPETVRDEFNSNSFSNNDGTVSWSGAWQELGESDGPNSGSVRVLNGELRLDDHNDHRPYPGAARQANLSGATEATLTFDYRTSGSLQESDTLVVQVSGNGGISWTTLETFVDDSSGSRSYDISAYIASNTQIRFEVTANYGGSTEYFYADNVQIEYSSSYPASHTVLDQFSTESYSNNNGTDNWAGPWTEISDDGSPSSGYVQVTGGELRLRYSGRGAARTANLSGYVQATFTFDYRTSNNLETDDVIVVQVSSNGGGSWVTLQTFSDDVSGSASYDISGYISTNTSIRFLITQGYTGGSYPNYECFYADDVQIEFHSAGGGGIQTVPGDPPDHLVTAADHYNLAPGERMTVTFQVTADNPPTVVQLLNTAWVDANELPNPLSDSTIDPMPPMDFGDLPTGYRVTREEYDGARHTIQTLFLGSAVDDEVNGQEDPAAEGDDTHGTDDDDGVLRDMADQWTPGASVDLLVTVSGGTGYLVGWFDWDGDGLLESGERVVFGNLTAGPHTLTITVPGNGSYQTGETVFARFRLYDGDPGDPLPTGYADSGEVEDYRWQFDSPTAVTLTSLVAEKAEEVGLWWLAAVAALAASSLLVVGLRRGSRSA